MEIFKETGMEYRDRTESQERIGTEQDRCSEAFSKYNLKVNEKDVEKAVKSIKGKVKSKVSDEDLRLILNCLDYTSLKQTDSDETILSMTEKINSFFGAKPDLKPYAAICVYPCYAKTVSNALEIEDIKVACVSGGFPSSQTTTEIKIAETAMAIHDGAEEIDIVQPVGRFLSEEYEYIADEISEIKAVCGERKLKVILESGAMPTLSDLRKAAILAMYSGADFLKTSTGKEASGATPESFYTICKAVRDYYDETGIKVGVKASGGISEIEESTLYLEIVNTVLGKHWMDKSSFRIGASRLADKLISAIG